MCGIVGIFDLHARRDVSLDIVSRMNESQFHRGPDDGDMHFEPGLALAHRRLSIIDLANGKQPLFNEDRSIAVVFNGEIYNYQELIPELEFLGHIFETQSDTEVIVHAWESWGEKSLDRLRGMFAFALWDRKQDVLFLARDRIGVKPLYYAELPNGMFAFASELKALLSYSDLPRQLDPCAIEEYFALGYVAEPRSIFQAVKKLPPGHTLMLRHGQAIPPPREYWDVHFTLDSRIGYRDACAELGARLQESMKLRMIADVPVGAFLSGGVDSSAVVAIMAGVSEEPVNTCSIGFSEEAYNETKFAQEVANRYGTNHYVERVATDDFDLIDTLASVYDEPFADSSAIPTYRVCQLARKHVKVALSGDGGDECFGGYRRYRMHLMEERMRSLFPRTVRQPLFGLLGRTYPKADWAPRMFRAKTTLEALARDSVGAYLHSVSIVRDWTRRKLFAPRLRTELGGYHVGELFGFHAARSETTDPLALIQYLDMKTYLVGDINTKVDRASMAHSLEVREPLMDHRLIEWLATLPSSFKVMGHEGKRVLKTAMEPHLPHEILYRPKMGFAVPLADWFRGPLRGRVRDALLGWRLGDTGMFNQAYVLRLIEDHENARRDHSAAIWALLMFEAFVRKYLH